MRFGRFGATAAYRVAPISELTHLVTERGVDDEMLKPYAAQGISIVQP